MKATGVVRRIDDLGRIVIPKEIRKNFKITEGDSLEIYVDRDAIILKKYAIIDNLSFFCKKIIDSFYSIYKKNILITDKDKVIASSITGNDNYLDMQLTMEIKTVINDRKEYCGSNSQILLNGKYENYYLLPLIIDSDIIGSIILVDSNINQDNKVTLNLLRSILVKYIEV